MCWLSLVVRSPPARRSLSWIHSLLIELWLLVTEVSTLSLILLTTQTMVTTGILPLQGKIPMVELGIEPGTSWLVVKLWPPDHEAGQVVCEPQFDNHWRPVMTCLLQRRLSALSTEYLLRAAIWTFQSWRWSVIIWNVCGSYMDRCKMHLWHLQLETLLV